MMNLSSLIRIVVTCAVTFSFTSNAAEREVWIFDCGGKFLKAIVSTGIVNARGSLIREANLPTQIDSSKSQQGYDGCVSSNFQVTPKRDVIVAVLAESRFADSFGRRAYQIAVLSRADLRQIAVKRIPELLNSEPRLMVAVDGKYALSVYETTLGSFKANSYHLTDLVESARPAMSHQVVEKVLGSPKSAFISNDQIQAGASIISLSPSDLGVEDIYANVFRWNQNISKLNGVRAANLDGKSLRIAFGDASRNTALFLSGWDASSLPVEPRHLVLYDIGTNAVKGYIPTPYLISPFDGTRGTPTAHLNPAGDLVIVEVFSWRGGVRIKSGQMAVYQVPTGTLLGNIVTANAPSGNERVLGFSAAGDTLYYQSGRQVYFVNMYSFQSVGIVTLPNGFEPVSIIAAD